MTSITIAVTLISKESESVMAFMTKSSNDSPSAVRAASMQRMREIATRAIYDDFATSGSQVTPIIYDTSAIAYACNGGYELTWTNDDNVKLVVTKYTASTSYFGYWQTLNATIFATLEVRQITRSPHPVVNIRQRMIANYDGVVDEVQAVLAARGPPCLSISQLPAEHAPSTPGGFVKTEIAVRQPLPIPFIPKVQSRKQLHAEITNFDSTKLRPIDKY